MLLFFDTETTGLTRLAFVTRFNHKKWPRLVKIAWTLADENGIEKIESATVFPADFEIPAEATRIHGITTKEAQSAGEPIQSILRRFQSSLTSASTIIAHNLSYDLGVIHAEAMRLGIEGDLQWPDKRLCTVALGQSYLVSKYGSTRPQRLSLSGLYKEVMGFDFSPKHDPVSDVRACAHIYFRLKSSRMLSPG